MPSLEHSLERSLTPAELDLFRSLTTPRKIQDFLDTVKYEPEYFNRAPLRVLRERTAHCLDGALFAAAALQRIGHPPLVIDLLPEPLVDDDHVLAIFQQNGAYGAVAKSNFTGLRYREPVFRTRRELVMSYFEDFFNSRGQKTLRAYTAPLNLAAFDALRWETDDAAADLIEARLKELRQFPVLTPAMIRDLSPVDRGKLEAGLLGADRAGLFKPGIA
ncbi:MAG: hypothetical protein BWY52_00476 [Chloroflexi bacterium ADurb.Bin325]|nr:MAG: hypothetical protein BWY52_00476 [Chloroflexi bacterium ADurb.Bin325]